MRTPPPGHRRPCGRRTARPPAGPGPGNVALILRHVTRDPQDPEPHRGSLVQLIEQRSQDAAAFGSSPWVSQYHHRSQASSAPAAASPGSDRQNRMAPRRFSWPASSAAIHSARPGLNASCRAASLRRCAIQLELICVPAGIGQLYR